jgi:hypothetical protein
VDSPAEVEIYVRLLDEGVDVWRPVRASDLGGGLFRIDPSVVPDDSETWEFPPGEVVVGALKKLSDGTFLVAIASAAGG